MCCLKNDRVHSSSSPLAGCLVELFDSFEVLFENEEFRKLYSEILYLLCSDLSPIYNDFQAFCENSFQEFLAFFKL